MAYRLSEAVGEAPNRVRGEYAQYQVSGAIAGRQSSETRGDECFINPSSPDYDGR